MRNIKNKEAIKNAVPIRKVIDHFIATNDKSKICCPFHQEKTASFHINEKRNTTHCFGQCDKTYDSIEFLQEYKGMSFPEAMEFLSGLCSIPLEYDNNQQQNNLSGKKTKLVRLNKTVLDYGLSTFGISSDNKETLSHILRQRGISPRTAQKFDLFYLPREESLRKAFSEDELKQISPSLEALGIIRKYEGKVYDSYKNRLVFPIKDNKGQLVGFAGRCLSDNPKIKYINSKENDIYKKSEILYGLSENFKAIRQLDNVFVVEGYLDLLSMVEHGFENVVALCGTAMTKQQMKLLSRFTQNITLLLDGDSAGIEASQRIIPIAVREGMNMSICPLAENDDPDSFLKESGKDKFAIHLQDKTSHGIRFLLENADTNTPISKGKILTQFLQLIAFIDNEFIIEDLKSDVVEILGIKKTRINQLVKDIQQNTESPYQNSFSNEEANDLHKYGFIERNNSYYKVTEKDIKPLSNFIIQPLYHLIGDVENFRLLEIKNKNGTTKLICFTSKNLVSIDSFSETIENQGNFIFYGTKRDLNMIKSKIFDKMKSCKEINVLGWQKEGFYAFANGILFENQFIPINDYGIIKVQNKEYFIPVNSSIFKDYEGEYEEEKRFLYTKGTTIFSEWVNLFTAVYAEDNNGKIAILYYIASLYRDIIFSKFRFFPHLFLFGKKGTGKSQMAWSLGSMFGEAQDQFMLDSGTNVGMGRKIAKFRNAITWFDEYKNSINLKRIQFLKGIYDGAGHVKGVKSQDNRTKKTAVNSACIISGQDLPTQDIALFSRSILLKTSKTTHSAEAKNRFNSLKELEDTNTLSSITGYILSFRKDIIDNYSKCFTEVNRLLTEKTNSLRDNVIIEDRILKNMSAIITIYWCFRKRLETLPFNDEEIIQITAQNIVRQSYLMVSSGDVSQFWDMVVYLYESHEILYGTDYEIRKASKIDCINVHGKKTSTDLPKNGRVLYLRLSKIVPKYKEHFRKQNGYSPLDKNILINYLESSKNYLGKKKSFRFSDKSNSSCLVFNYNDMDIELNKPNGQTSSDY